jgi:hypothetical protein
MSTAAEIQFRLAGIESLSDTETHVAAKAVRLAAPAFNAAGDLFREQYVAVIKSDQLLGFSNRGSDPDLSLRWIELASEKRQTLAVAGRDQEVLLMALLMALEYHEAVKVRVQHCTVQAKLLREALDIAVTAFPGLERPVWVPAAPDFLNGQMTITPPPFFDFRA